MAVLLRIVSARGSMHQCRLAMEEGEDMDDGADW